MNEPYTGPGNMNGYRLSESDAKLAAESYSNRELTDKLLDEMRFARDKEDQEQIQKYQAALRDIYTVLCNDEYSRLDLIEHIEHIIENVRDW